MTARPVYNTYAVVLEVVPSCLLFSNMCFDVLDIWWYLLWGSVGDVKQIVGGICVSVATLVVYCQLVCTL